MDTNIHNVEEIKISSIRKIKSSREKGFFYVRDFEFIDDKGHKVEITAFNDDKKKLSFD